ncbi:hypothetical protein RFI_05770 [Reticulomyxa filosa]|uniref:PI3K/PI4K catalytic domain-containing protein n=1 Tax=Reticulomyxa filosa TaxID=46433 RepID=X6NZT3_RETFI|nr:hypothetical protein RFI_05770 [Reticulomyxa filosa]|eukprot:ETO31349.1 hypothetical protein RFI_05770 [Reticulomyxa filosa]
MNIQRLIVSVFIFLICVFVYLFAPFFFFLMHEQCWKHWSNGLVNKYFRNQSKQSCVIICESPSLRYGDVLHIINAFNSSKNFYFQKITKGAKEEGVVIQTITHFFYFFIFLETVKKKKKRLRMKVYYFPIDARLSIREVAQLIQKVRCKQVITSESNCKRILQHTKKISTQIRMIGLERHTDICLNLHLSEFVRLSVDANLLHSRLLSNSHAAKSFVEIRGWAHSARNNASRVLMLDTTSHLLVQHQLYGDINSDKFIQELVQSQMKFEIISQHAETAPQPASDLVIILSNLNIQVSFANDTRTIRIEEIGHSSDPSQFHTRQNNQLIIFNLLKSALILFISLQKKTNYSQYDTQNSNNITQQLLVNKTKGNPGEKKKKKKMSGWLSWNNNTSSNDQYRLLGFICAGIIILITVYTSKRRPKTPPPPSNFYQQLRKGDLQPAIEGCEEVELSDNLSLLTAFLSEIPFGGNRYKRELLDKLYERIKESGFLQQSFMTLIYSNLDGPFFYEAFRNHGQFEKLISMYIKKGVKQGSLIPLQASVKKVNDKTLEYHGNNILELFSVLASGNGSKEKAETDIAKVLSKNNSAILHVQLHNYMRHSNGVHMLSDPMTGNGNVKSVEVVKVFNSNAKPLLIKLNFHNVSSFSSSCSEMVFKTGDDLRKDASVLSMIQFMNLLWQENSATKHVHALTYKCIPMSGDKWGVIEFVPNCIPLRDVASLNGTLKDQQIDQLIASAAGSFIASFILGVLHWLCMFKTYTLSATHRNNVLLHNHKFRYEIDILTMYLFENPTLRCSILILATFLGFVFSCFFFLLLEKLSGLDADEMAITSDLQKLMDKKWDTFVGLCVQAFIVLRNNHHDIVQFAKVALPCLEWNSVRSFLLQKLLVADDVTSDDAATHIREKVTKAPGRWKTKIKNTLHTFAVKSI